VEASGGVLTALPPRALEPNDTVSIDIGRHNFYKHQNSSGAFPFLQREAFVIILRLSTRATISRILRSLHLMWEHFTRIRGILPMARNLTPNCLEH